MERKKKLSERLKKIVAELRQDMATMDEEEAIALAVAETRAARKLKKRR